MPVYRGFRGQEQAGIRITKGSAATEGDGVYIAFDRDFAMEFSGREYLQELGFRLDNPLVVHDEPPYMVTGEGDLEAPVQSSDSDWLQANKIAYQRVMKKENNKWERAGQLVGRYLTSVMLDMGYDGVIIEWEGNRWAVVFNPENVRVIRMERHASVSRDARLAQMLVCSRVG